LYNTVEYSIYNQKILVMKRNTADHNKFPQGQKPQFDTVRNPSRMTQLTGQRKTGRNAGGSAALRSLQMGVQKNVTSM
jgi:hypothetical protein